MREAIRSRIVADVPEFKDVLEPHMADANTKKPFCMIQRGGDVEEIEWIGGYRQTIEIWPLVDRTSYTVVDDFIQSIVDSLTREPITDTDDGTTYTCIYQGSGADQIVLEDFDAITRSISFSVMSTSPTGDPDHGVTDPWVEALAEWTRTVLPVPWAVYTRRLEPGYTFPFLLWRLNDVKPEVAASGLIKVTKTMTGHIMARTPSEESYAGVDIAVLLMDAMKIPLDKPLRKYMTVTSPAFNVDASGQLTVTLHRLEQRQRPTYPVMNKIEGRKDVNPNEHKEN